EDRLEFVVPPVFHETIWFKLFCGTVTVLALVGAYSWRIDRLRTTQKLELEAQKRERTRIAQELHDTLLQGFTGVGLKLDALTNTLPASLNATKEQFQKTLQLLDQSLTEGRRSVMKLRSPTLEGARDFSEALQKASERALNGTPIALSVSVQGKPRKLKELFEDNLLRICEEAVANAVKHA